MAHHLPNVLGTAVNVLGTAGALAARPTGEARSRDTPPDPVKAPPAAAELQGGLAGLRQTAELVNTAALQDEPTAASTQVALAPAPGSAAVSGAPGQLPDDDTVGRQMMDGDPASAAVSTHSGPQDDPYDLAAGPARSRRA